MPQNNYERAMELLAQKPEGWGKLKSLLTQCTPDQMNLFNRMYGSIENIPADKIPWAIKQAEATLKKRVVDEERSHPKAILLYRQGEQLGASTFIDEVTTTYGYGKLNDYGVFEYELFFKE